MPVVHRVVEVIGWWFLAAIAAAFCWSRIMSAIRRRREAEERWRAEHA